MRVEFILLPFSVIGTLFFGWVTLAGLLSDGYNPLIAIVIFAPFFLLFGIVLGFNIAWIVVGKDWFMKKPQRH